MSNRILFWGAGSPRCLRTMVVLEEKKLQYDSKLVDMYTGGHKGPDVVAVNPRGQLPAFKDGGVCVNESLGIISYLDEFYPEPALMPKDRAAKGHALQRFHEGTTPQDILQTCIGGRMKGNDDEAFQKDVENLKVELSTWEKYLAGNEYIAGPSFTLADVSLAGSLFATKQYGATFDEFPNLKVYIAKLEARPSFTKILPLHMTEATKFTYLCGHL